MYKKEVFMKKACMLLIWCFVGIFSANAQKFALIDMEYILENIPEYQKANEELNLVSQQYQKAIEAKAKEAETLYTAYQKAASSLNASQRTQKEEAIIAKEKEAAELRKKYFGPEGEMSQKEEALIAPIQNKIYEAVKQISQKNGYDAVIDRASATSIIFASPRIDISNEVLSRLGYSN
jgi:outer membrane protein